MGGAWWRALGLVAIGTLTATLIGELDVAPSPIAVALLLGLAASPFVDRIYRGGEGGEVGWLGRFALRTGVVLLGFRITLDDISELGATTLVLAVAVSISVLLITVAVARRLDIGRRLGTLLGIGSAICGASAVAAAGTTIEASEEETAYAIATVTLIGTVATFALPAVGTWVGLGDQDLGVWIGMMVHDVGQVVAASTTVSDAALTAAVPVKLVRVLLLVPVLAILAGTALARMATRDEPNTATSPADEPETDLRSGRLRLRGLVPLFVVLFVVASIVSSTGIVPDAVTEASAQIERILFTAALFAIGVSVHLPTLRRIGARPALTSALVWCLACAVTLAALSA